ncbi:hypothetical protein VBM87_01545 [Mycoplasma sp. 744]|uniref:hypothetical protein n=1 Tax=Mycoplasma sp. 744 TaxID=3108531 RepID=UPI002B1DD5CF|nr:hypothetical protein [Mycoplasma sp. 744]MEA4115465.1 hypothetical protein [Mycoplasma sp. 744]
MTTTYFETFDRKGYKKTDYSKDGKFKEDQIVFGMPIDSNAISVHYKVFAKKYNWFKYIYQICFRNKINNVTIIANKSMSVNKNIRFCENKDLNFIISYRMKTSNRQFKEYVLKQEDYVHSDIRLVYKTQEFASLYIYK